MKNKITRLCKQKDTHCKRGHEYTEETEYYNSDGYRSCKACKNILNKNWVRKVGRDSINRKRKEWKYGITSEEYDQKLEEQNGVCAISGLAPTLDITKGMLCVDHDHSTNQCRSLLHGNINLALGLFQDNPDWLRKAADYIEFWRKKHAVGGFEKTFGEMPS